LGRHFAYGRPEAAILGGDLFWHANAQVYDFSTHVHHTPNVLFGYHNAGMTARVFRIIMGTYIHNEWRKPGNMNRIKIDSVFKLMEICIAILLLFTIAFTAKEIIAALWHNISNNTLLNHYKIILSEILLLAIGVEMAFLLIKKDIYFVIDILILAMARKLITYENSLDLLVSIICVVLLLGARIVKIKYLEQLKSK
jgi:hypothetical protein